MRYLSSIVELEEALLAARQDEPSSVELARYKQLFKHVNVTVSSSVTESFMERVSQWIQAKLVWDSRQEPLLQGMRSGAAEGHRLRYMAGRTSIELAVENKGRLRDLEGEIYSADESSALLSDTGPALVMLLRHGELVAETASDEDGRFEFLDLMSGDYAMTFFLEDQSRIDLVALNLP